MTVIVIWNLRLQRSETALQKKEAHQRALLAAIPDLVIRINRAGITLELTAPANFRVLGEHRENWVGTHVSHGLSPELAQKRLDVIAKALETRSIQIYEHTLVLDDQIQVEEVRVVPYSDDEVLLLVRDISDSARLEAERKRAEEQLKHDALHDGLTGLPNRNLLLERLDLALKRAKRHSDFQFAVLFLDLDHFKVINDSLGHSVGDELLIAVANQLKTFVRETDMAARLGGDEFVLLVEEIEGLSEAIVVAKRILELFKSPLVLNERQVFTSASIGILTRDINHRTAEDLLRDADLGMYRAKQDGRKQYAIFDPHMHLQAMQRLQLENELRRGLENQEFVLYYQPIISLATGAIRGFEALIRWQHPEYGLVMPGEFIAVAEETRLIVPIGRWILQAACAQMAAWQVQFPEQSLRMSVNLSVQQLQPKLLDHLDSALKQSGLLGERLVLEITESMLVRNLEATDSLLKQLKTRGIHLSIDDFGTGYSSLSYLHQLPADALKIDRAFVSPNERDVRSQTIAESIVALSNLLELNAIAEGIETLEQLQWLQSLGCELGQGNWFSRPLPADQATIFISQSLSSFSYEQPNA
ncbi:MAG: putative bifunctional diguanylate cyclase/phosphodiesterase [Leptolyngbyaceae cyanobacterium]